MSSVITALLSGLRNHGFRVSLSKKPTESMTELLWQGEEYIDQEEVLRATRCDREVYDSGNKKTRRDEPSTIRQNIKNSTDYIYRPRHDLVHAISQIQLNAPLSDMLREISTLKELQWPEKLRSDPSIRDRGRMCEFHKDHGHTTDQCRTLRSELVEEIPGTQGRVMHGRCDIADFDVRRVLVDTGSAANVMSWEAFKGLKIPTDRLKSMNTPLQGFGGGTVIPEGIVVLPVVLGQHPYSVTLITPFLIVNTPMAYNSIYGRPIINSAGAIISTQHQCMKFPTGRGISIIRGDQLTSRRCYVDSIQHETHPTMLMIEIDEFPQAQRF
ncbi:Uncharacterized protein Adt_05790 [Abeliophyllum distichum]|uniref:Peptidase A2 domain-containing protein n=1 Tax=Abeliophyllum distichum TaxID=126358 RepID=A0ABD1V525_9LAMI